MWPVFRREYWLSDCGLCHREEVVTVSDTGVGGRECPWALVSARAGVSRGAWAVLEEGGLVAVRDGSAIKRLKGIWWMPWHREAMKDVARCDKPWGVASER